ncbi:putative ABC transport system ATP-binding protein [Lysobacter niabensis]|uniref:ABC transport system ATP-binding protein n=1 Tax=Agrilutibacter niabensis TaxID=380628 RepID=A0ABU1VT38_9GAMM|nr:putative ABC transport system ATP-binding protein [Lysobacter niabensis]
MERPAVRCRGLTKHYGEGEASVPALQGVDLDVRPGELLMLVGPSGCGKTTLVSIITTVLDQDGGECEVLGHDMRVMGERERARLRNEAIGIVFQSFHLLPALSALDNVAVPLLLAHVPRAEAETRARRALDSVGLGTRRDALPARLSGGESQRVAIARALVREPKLLVCDEPTSNLDASTGHTVMEMLRDVAKASDRALLVVTHDSRIFDFADRIARMEDGRVVEVTDNMQPGAAA